MKAWHIVAILTLLLLVGGCKQAVVEEPAEAAPVAEEVVEEAPVAEEEVVQSEAAERKDDLSYESSDATVQRLITACKAGNVGLCVVLKNKYGIDVSAEEAPAEEAAVEEEAPVE